MISLIVLIDDIKTMKTLCKNRELYDEMEVIFRDKKVMLKFAIINCKAGEPIEGIHPFQHDKLLKRFETDRGKKFQYSIDIRYGDWRFILFDIGPVGNSNKPVYINTKYINFDLPKFVRPIQL